MEKQSCILGIDIGTTSAKAVAFAENGTILAHSEAELQLIITSDDVQEQEPYDVYDKINHVILDVMHHITENGYFVRLVGFSAAMHSLLPIGENGRPLGNVLTWLDGRAHQEASAIWATRAGHQLYKQTGTPVHAMSPMVKLVWMRRVKPEIFYAASKFVSLKEWIWHQWFGVWEVDESIASASGLLNLNTRQWDNDVLAFVHIKDNHLSTVVPTTFIRQDCIDARLLQVGITSTTQFNIGASDGVLASLGVDAVENGIVALTMGTSLAVRMFSKTIQTHEEIRSFCYLLNQNRYIIGAPSNSGGIILSWIYNKLLINLTSIDEAINQAEAANCETLYCLPYISGERAPLWDSESKASFIGLGLQHSGIHMMRAAIEGILFNAYWISSNLFHIVGQPELLIVSGKLFEVRWVSQLLADIFNIKVQVNSITDAAIQGAIRLAIFSTQVNSKKINVGNEFEAYGQKMDKNDILVPQQHNKYERKFNEFCRLASLLFPSSNECTIPKTVESTP